MSKGIIVLDIPETCFDCPMMNGSDECILQDEDTNAFYSDDYDGLRKGCPIKELPKKRDYKGPDAVTGFSAYDRAGVAIHEAGKLGWNSCIDEILKETGD